MPDPINTNKASVRFVADGEITDFHFNFMIFSTEDIEVYLDSTLQTEGFTVNESTNSEGGNVVFATAPAMNTVITIARRLEVKRTTNFSESKAFRAKMLNFEFDYQVACLEQLYDDLKRNISVPVYGDSDVNTSLPLPEPGKAILWNAEGTGLINSKINVEELDSAVNDSVKAAADAIQAASTAADAAAEATGAAHNKANKNLDNVEDDHIKAKAGTRIYISEPFAVGPIGTNIFTHNLNLSDPFNTKQEIFAECIADDQGHKAGDIIFNISTSGKGGAQSMIHQIALQKFADYTSFILGNSRQIEILQPTGVIPSLTAAKWNFRFKIIY